MTRIAQILSATLLLTPMGDVARADVNISKAPESLRFLWTGVKRSEAFIQHALPILKGHVDQRDQGVVNSGNDAFAVADYINRWRPMLPANIRTALPDRFIEEFNYVGDCVFRARLKLRDETLKKRFDGSFIESQTGFLGVIISFASINRDAIKIANFRSMIENPDYARPGRPEFAPEMLSSTTVVLTTNIGSGGLSLPPVVVVSAPLGNGSMPDLSANVWREERRLWQRTLPVLAYSPQEAPMIVDHLRAVLRDCAGR